MSRRLLRWGLPAALILAGACLSYTGAPVPGTPTYIPRMDPVSLTFDRQGRLYIVTGNYFAALHQVWRISRAGGAILVAGCQGPAEYREGIPATEARLWCDAVAIDAEGNLYLADQYNQRVCKVDTKGILTTLAGSGQAGFSGDGGPATAARLTGPCAVAVDPQGGVLLCDSGNNRVRRVDPSGTISTIAGNGRPEDTGDGGPAIRAGLRGPGSIAVMPDGSLYVWTENRARRIDPHRVIHTVDSHAGWAGELAVDAAGRRFVVGPGNTRVLVISRRGHAAVAAGSGRRGSAGDGCLATNAEIDPRAIAVSPGGELFLASYCRVRKVDRRGIIRTVVIGEPRLRWWW